MSTTVPRAKKLWHRRSAERSRLGMMFGMRSAAARAEVRSTAGARVVASGPGYEVKLVHISRGTSPEYRTECVADILCLDLHEFGLPEAIAWVEAAMANSQGVDPCIAVLGSTDKLTR